MKTSSPWFETALTCCRFYHHLPASIVLPHTWRSHKVLWVSCSSTSPLLSTLSGWESLCKAGDQDLMAWITDYLTDRSQYVWLQGCLSDVMTSNTGIPQRTILSCFCSPSTPDFCFASGVPPTEVLRWLLQCLLYHGWGGGGVQRHSQELYPLSAELKLLKSTFSHRLIQPHALKRLDGSYVIIHHTAAPSSS